MLRSIQKNSGKQAYFVFSTGKTATTLPTCRSQDPAYCIHSWSSRTNIYFSTYSDLAKVLGVGKNCFSILKIIICFLFQLIKIIFSIVLKRHFWNILLLWDGLISVIISLHNRITLWSHICFLMYLRTCIFAAYQIDCGRFSCVDMPRSRRRNCLQHSASCKQFLNWLYRKLNPFLFYFLISGLEQDEGIYHTL